MSLKDYLVPPQSSKPIMSAISSEDKKLIEFNRSCWIKSKSHKQLWLLVKWLIPRS